MTKVNSCNMNLCMSKKLNTFIRLFLIIYLTPYFDIYYRIAVIAKPWMIYYWCELVYVITVLDTHGLNNGRNGDENTKK